MDTARLLAELTNLLGGENVLAQAAPLGIAIPAAWTHAPFATLLPGSVEEIAGVVRLLESAGAALVVVGGGTQIQTGYPPSAHKPYALLSTRRMNRILDYQPDDMTITCEPGVTLTAVQETLAAHRQFLPLDAPLPRYATMGGIVSTNASGFRRMVYGAARDLVIGLRAVMTDGAQIKGGGKVVKNVAGYDVCKLFTGAWGSVGVITEITFKVYPQPEGARLLRLNAPDLETAARVGLLLHHAQIAPAALLATNELAAKGTEGSPVLLVLLQGIPPRMDWQMGEIERMGVEAGLGAPEILPAELLDGLRDKQARLDANTPFAARIACPPAETASLLAKLQSFAGVAIMADCAMGIVNVAANEPDMSFVHAVADAASSNANVQWTRLDASNFGQANADEMLTLLRDINVWGHTREGAALQRALKQSLDPKGTFSPGRFVERL